MTAPASAPSAEKPNEYWKGVFMAIGLAVGVPMAWGSAFGAVGLAAESVLGSIVGSAIQAVGMLGAMAFFAIGPVQWLWINPLAKKYGRDGRDSLAKGLVTGGWIVVLLNTSCWGILLGAGLWKR